MKSLFRFLSLAVAIGNARAVIPRQANRRSVLTPAAKSAACAQDDNSESKHPTRGRTADPSTAFVGCASSFRSG